MDGHILVPVKEAVPPPEGRANGNAGSLAWGKNGHLCPNSDWVVGGSCLFLKAVSASASPCLLIWGLRAFSGGLSEGQRRIKAIMFTDMVGYTALGQRNEILALALVEEQKKLIRPILAKHGGREVKTIGDAILMEFPNAVDAVRCAYDIQRAIREFNLSLASDKRVHLRIGIHLGEVVDSLGDIMGDAVNVASRIEPLSEDGGVCLSRQVYDHVRNKVDLQLISLGPRSLRNVAEPVEVYKMVMPWSTRDEAQPKELDRRHVAVLPFANMSPDPNDGYFADGMTEEMISALSRIQSLRVISRTSVMRYKDQTKSAAEVGQELRVGTLLEGSVRKAGNRVRITVQLIDAGTDHHLWAETYDRNLDDIFAIQSDVASRVAGSLAAGVFTVARKGDTTDVEAYTLYLRAMQLVHQGTEQSLREAIELFEQAISKEGSFVRPYWGIVEALDTLGGQQLEDFEEVTKRSEAAARKALEVGPEWAEAHAAMSTSCLQRDRTREAISEAERALQLNPSLSEVYEVLGEALASRGDLELGIQNLEMARELDPLSYHIGHLLCYAYQVDGEMDKALELGERLKRLYPNNPAIYGRLAGCYLQAKDLARAQELIEAGLRINPGYPWLIIARGQLYSLRDDRRKAEEQLRLLGGSDESVRLSGEVWVRTALGDLDEAMEALLRLADLHAWDFLLSTNPFFEELRKHPRFAEFAEKVELEGIPHRTP